MKNISKKYFLKIEKKIKINKKWIQEKIPKSKNI